MKDMLKIHTEATKLELCEVLAETGFLAKLATGFLFWFESPDLRAAAMEAVTAAFPGATFDVIEPEPVKAADEPKPKKKRKKKAKTPVEVLTTVTDQPPTDTTNA